MSTTSTSAPFTRVAALDTVVRRADDAERPVFVTLYHDDYPGLPVVGMTYQAEPDEGRGMSDSSSRTWTAGSNETAALAALTVAVLLQARVDAETAGTHPPETETIGRFTVPDGLAAAWLADL